jgi:hypothetical protein
MSETPTWPSLTPIALVDLGGDCAQRSLACALLVNECDRLLLNWFLVKRDQAKRDQAKRGRYLGGGKDREKSAC